MPNGSITSRVLAGAALALNLATGTAGAQEDVATFYKGKQVTIFVGSSPGGGYDTYSRLIARHMSKHIPGNPTMVVSNMPGAGGNLAANPSTALHRRMALQSPRPSPA